MSSSESAQAMNRHSPVFRPTAIGYVAEQIKPAIDHSLEGAARIDATITAQVRLVRSRLAAEADLATRIASGRLAVVGARYELTSQIVHEVR